MTRIDKYENIDLRTVLKFLCTSRKQLLAIASSALFLFSLLCLVMPHKFAATAVIMPPQQETSPFHLQNINASPLALLALQNALDSGELYIDILQSERAVQEVLKTELARGGEATDLLEYWHVERLQDAIETLRQATVIDKSPAGLISVKIILDDAELAAQIANTYFAVLDSILQRQNRQQNAATRRYLQTQLQSNSAKLRAATDSLAFYRSRYRIIAPADQATGILGQLAELKSKMITKEMQIEMFKNSMQVDNPQLLLAQEEHIALQRQYNKLQTKQDGDNDVFASLYVLPRLLARLADLERETKTLELVWQFLTEQLQRTRFQEQQNMPVIHFLDRAIPDEKPVWPKPFIVIPVGVFACTLIGIVLLLAHKFITFSQDDEKNSRDEYASGYPQIHRVESSDLQTPSVSRETDIQKN